MTEIVKTGKAATPVMTYDEEQNIHRITLKVPMQRDLVADVDVALCITDAETWWNTNPQLGQIKRGVRIKECSVWVDSVEIERG